MSKQYFYYDNNMRAVFDTETTGTKFSDDRVVSIGVIIGNGDKNIQHYYQELNPDGKESDYEAYRVHGLSNEHLAKQPKFSDTYKDFLDVFFKYPINNVVIHNADFDTGMISQEFNRLRSKGIEIDKYMMTTYPDFIPQKYRKYVYSEKEDKYLYTGKTFAEIYQDNPNERFSFIDLFPVEDTILIATNFYGKLLSLDKMADSLEVDRTARSEYHGALVDVEILFNCYNKMKETILSKQDFFEMQLDLTGLRFPMELKVKPEDRLSEELANQLSNIKPKLDIKVDNDKVKDKVVKTVSSSSGFKP